MFRIGGRGTVVRLTSGDLAVFSPIALTPEVRTRIDSMGSNVKYLAALDYEHHIFLSEWSRAYPAATIIGVEGLPEKREKNKETAGLRFTHVFTRSNKNELKIGEEFDRDFEYEYLPAHRNKELVFYYKPDRTLIEADVLFNLPAREQYTRSKEDPTSGFFNTLFNGLMNAKGEAKWQRRMLWYGPSPRNEFNQSIKKISGWDFERIIPCHGDVIEENGQEVWKKMFAWNLKAAAEGK